MSLIQVDTTKCKRDDICIETCPLKIIERKTDEAFPTMVEGGDTLCVQCGHCVAICPHQAMNHTAMDAEQCPPIVKELHPTPEQAEQLLKARRSIRTFKDKKVARELLTRLIHVARYAPSGHNTQPVEWLVVDDATAVHELAGKVVDWMRLLVNEESPLANMLHMDRIIQGWESGVDRIFRGAPHLIIAHAPQELRTSQSSCIIALSYLELMATALGLGACWAGYFMAAASSHPPTKQSLGLPSGHAVYGCVMVGYPKFRYHRLPLRNIPKITWR